MVPLAIPNHVKWSSGSRVDVSSVVTNTSDWLEKLSAAAAPVLSTPCFRRVSSAALQQQPQMMDCFSSSKQPVLLPARGRARVPSSAAEKSPLCRLGGGVASAAAAAHCSLEHV